MRKEDKIIISVVILIGLFAFGDIVRRVCFYPQKNDIQDKFVSAEINIQHDSPTDSFNSRISYPIVRKSHPNIHSNSEPSVYSKERGEYIPISEQQKIYKRKFEEELAEQRYNEYVKNCILEKAGNTYKTSHAKAGAFLKINKDGYVENYNIFGISDPVTRKYADGDSSSELKKDLEKAILAASPFQPFSPNMEKQYIVFGIQIGCNQVSLAGYANNFEPKWQYSINQTGKIRNQNRVENTKLISSYINLRGHNSSGHPVYSRWIPAETINLNWKPVKTENSLVVITRPINNGRFGKPKFEKKASLEAANRAALKAVELSRMPDISGMEKYDSVSVLYNFEVK